MAILLTPRLVSINRRSRRWFDSQRHPDLSRPLVKRDCHQLMMGKLRPQTDPQHVSRRRGRAREPNGI